MRSRGYLTGLLVLAAAALWLAWRYLLPGHLCPYCHGEGACLECDLETEWK